MIVTTWMPVPLNQNGNKLFLIQRLLIVFGTGLSAIRFFFSSLPSLVAVSSFPTSASEKSQYVFSLNHILSLVSGPWVIEQWLDAQTWLCMAGSGASQKPPADVCNQLHCNQEQSNASPLVMAACIRQALYVFSCFSLFCEHLLKLTE